MQNKEIFDKQQISSFKRFKYKETDLHYQGSYELDFLNKYFNIIEINNGPSIKYTYNGKNKVYHSDFYLQEQNLIIEIKSDYIYNLHLKTNLVKQNACIEQGFKFIFILDKDYEELNKIIYMI